MPGLNASQKRAVDHETGPLLVLAGAGSGKTRVLTHRIARLVEKGTKPEAILAVSFTNKAAAEMGERMVPLVGAERAARLALSTFHRFGVRLLSEEIEALDLGGRFVIFDQGDGLGVVREALSRLRRSGARRLDPGAILARISIWKNRFQGPNDLEETDVEYDEAAREVYPRYEAMLRAMSAVDFDDLVVAPVRLLEKRADLRQKWRRRFRHLLVDEFQDTNKAQLELVRLLANDDRNVCVVGDDDQAIYAWRGADVANVLEFERHFPGAKVVTLEDNYRSKSAILEVANAAIAASAVRMRPKKLRSARGEGDRVRVCVLDDPPAEARFVVREIAARQKSGTAWGEFGILYRSSILSRAIEEALRAEQIPYRLFGGTQLFDRKEVKDAAAYLRVVVNPKDEISLRRILNWPPRGIGETTVDRVERFAKAKKTSFPVAFAEMDRIDDVPDAAKVAARQLQGTLDAARGAFRRSRRLGEVARKLLSDVGLQKALLSDESAAASRRVENVEFLLGALDRYEKSESAEKPSLLGFLTRIAVAPEDDGDARGNRVTLSTLHAAKGLEFGVVFLVGCVEGQLPHSRTTDPKVTDAAPADVEEERRLFYVGVTRARDRLYLTRPRHRLARGRNAPLAPSRFLEGLPESQMEVVEETDEAPLEGAELAAMARDLIARLGT